MICMKRELSAALVFGAMLLSPTAFASAQDAGAPAASTSEGTGKGVADPDEAAAQCIRASGFTAGYNKAKGTFVVSTSAGFPCGPDKPQSFTDCRNMAFQQAMLDAKKQVAEFLAAEVKSYVGSVLTEPALADPAVKEMGGDQAAGLVANSAKTAEEKKQLVSSSAFASCVEVIAKQEVAALQCFQSFEAIAEGKGRVAVVAIMSPKSIQMAKAMLGQVAEGVQATAKEPILDWVGKIESDGMLLYTHGVIQRSNENGELCLVAFGQSAPRTDSGPSMDAAYQKARNSALQLLRQFAGEMVTSSSTQSTAFTMAEFADKSSEFTNDSSFQQITEATAAKLTLPGAAQVRRTKLKHPLTPDRETAIVVMEWNVSSADASAELKATLDAMRGSEGGAGRSETKKSAPKSSAPPRAKPPANGDGTGAPGSADDT